MTGRPVISTAEPLGGDSPSALASPNSEGDRSHAVSPGKEIDVQLARRRRLVAERWNLADATVLIGAGVPLAIPGRADRTYPFRSHSEYLYLTDRERPGGVLAFDPADGWIDFVVPVTRDEQLWGGAPVGKEEGRPIGELAPWLKARTGRSVAWLGTPLPNIISDAPLAETLRAELNAIRRQKDEVELERMRRAEAATSAGFAAVQPFIRPGVTERALQIEIEAAFFRNGADALAFDTIVGTGSNTAVLHFSPTSRPAGAADLVLIDAGGECRGYASDVTRTYPASGRFTPEQTELHALVERAALAAIARCTAATEFVDVHRTAALVIATGLVDFGLLRGQPESLVERGAHAVFFPHGVGHMVGLGIRDAGEVLPGRKRPDDEFPRLRIDLPLLPGHVVTIEPGVYMVPALINDPGFRARYADAVDWERAERMLSFGGIRIEHNVLVTEDDPEVLTAGIPIATD